MKLASFLSILVISIGAFLPARASTLVVSGYLTGTSGELITDTSTGLEWLVPSYTRGQTYDDAAIQSIISNFGFQYATEAQVEEMINANFNNPPTTATTAGYTDAQLFFNIFGINEQVSCEGGPCPRTQGLTSTSSAAGYQDAVGMIQIGSTGYLIEGNSWPDSISDTQMGSWLVLNPNAQVSATPEPGSLLLLGTGIASLAGFVRRRTVSHP